VAHLLGPDLLRCRPNHWQFSKLLQQSGLGIREFNSKPQGHMQNTYTAAFIDVLNGTWQLNVASFFLTLLSLWQHALLPHTMLTSSAKLCSIEWVAYWPCCLQWMQAV